MNWLLEMGGISIVLLAGLVRHRRLRRTGTVEPARRREPA
jgi:hypothetical protein